MEMVSKNRDNYLKIALIIFILFGGMVLTFGSFRQKAEAGSCVSSDYCGGSLFCPIGTVIKDQTRWYTPPDVLWNQYAIAEYDFMKRHDKVTYLVDPVPGGQEYHVNRTYSLAPCLPDFAQEKINYFRAIYHDSNCSAQLQKTNVCFQKVDGSHVCKNNIFGVPLDCRTCTDVRVYIDYVGGINDVSFTKIFGITRYIMPVSLRSGSSQGGICKWGTELFDGFSNTHFAYFKVPSNYQLLSITNVFRNHNQGSCNISENMLMEFDSEPVIVTYCGDNKINGTEQCDEGDANTDTCYYGETCCNTACKNVQGPHCGDNVVNGFEQCDEGSSNGITCTPGYGGRCSYCDALCQEETLEGGYCGDGKTDLAGGEECDDGDINNLNSCDNSCSITYCGDGITQSPNGKEFLDGGDKFFEECDDGNNINGDECSYDCLDEGQPWLQTKQGDVFSSGGIVFWGEKMPDGEHLSNYLCLTGIGSFDVGGAGCSSFDWEYDDPHNPNWRNYITDEMDAFFDDVRVAIEADLLVGVDVVDHLDSYTLDGLEVNSLMLRWADKDLTISGDVEYADTVTDESTAGLIYLVNGDLEIEPDVNTAVGLYLVQGNVHILGSSDLVQLTVDGGIMAKGQISLERTLGVGNKTDPAEIIIYDPRYIDIFRDFFGNTNNVQFVESGVY